MICTRRENGMETPKCCTFQKPISKEFEGAPLDPLNIVK